MNETTVHIYGYSYPEKSVKQSIASQYKKIGSADFHDGILHGTANGQSHDLYAPFSILIFWKRNLTTRQIELCHSTTVLMKSIYYYSETARETQKMEKRYWYYSGLKFDREEETRICYFAMKNIWKNSPVY
ncbi:hypothetical protein KHA80_04965 [Anaerobacillus sp. HL2]|nr:hypothetical protein KHA80_04965 [Anaerobacillus sp. HL2]